MARTAITTVSIPNTGVNITDATYTTMATGTDNGVTFPHDSRDVIILRNDTGGPATFTLIVNVPPELTAIGVTPANQTVVVATGKTVLLKPGTAIIGSDTARTIAIDCDVAAKILVRNVPS